MVILHNVTDVRDGRHYSEVRVNEKKARYFIPDED